MEYDIDTQANTQWFYYSVEPYKNDLTINFSLVNLSKSESLYSQGLKPLIYSERYNQEKGIGWHRDGTNVMYYKNNSLTPTGGSYYTLSFTYKFKYFPDKVYFAQCYPYTYTNLTHYI